MVKVYQGTFKQDFSTLTSDSAYFYPQDNAFDAFGHVNINQGDTLNIYSDKLNYNGNTKIALLTDNVRMVDKDATLTTNHLTYNTSTRIGTYTDGGKLVNKDNTLLSKNGYYFAFTRDSYFRYDVTLTTPDALIKTDTMRYNTGSKIAYFYGPTNIYSTKGQKDRDTLYTENGNYNTVVEQAAFGKNNLYHSGTKSLKGDSLFYDKVKGYGRAVKHVTFADKEQKTIIKGNLGTYFKAEEKAIVTEDPYIVIVTEQKDSTKHDTVTKADSILKKAPPTKGNGNMNMAQVIKNSIPSKTDTPAAIKQIVAVAPKDSITKNAGKLQKLANDPKNRAQADELIKGLANDPKVTNMVSTAIKKQSNNPKVKNALTAAKTNSPEKETVAKDTSHIKRDSIYMSADTIETQILTYKDLKIYQEKQRLAHIRDTATRVKAKVAEKPSKFLVGKMAWIAPDTTFRHTLFFGKPKPVPVKKKPVRVLTKKQLAADSLRRQKMDDSIATAKKLEPSDTARIRIVIAHHHAKLFKSDLQAKADSMFYSYSDSTIRCFVNPIIWTEGSQLSGDTVFLQMKHKKLDNMAMFLSALIVNIDKGDSVHFNQIAGKRMRGYFKDDKLNRMYINGNAESIYFSRDSVKKIVDGMERSLSSRMTIDFKNSQVTNIGWYVKPEHKYTPIAKVKEDDKILKGFLWKPKERPISKESIIPSYNKKIKDNEKAAADKLKKNKPVTGKLTGGKTAVKDSSNAIPLKLPGLKTAKDSTLNPVKDAIKTAKDSTGKAAPPVKLPGVKAAKDSTTVKPAIKKN